jgi:hypothetical protein
MVIFFARAIILMILVYIACCIWVRFIDSSVTCNPLTIICDILQGIVDAVIGLIIGVFEALLNIPFQILIALVPAMNSIPFNPISIPVPSFNVC